MTIEISNLLLAIEFSAYSLGQFYACFRSVMRAKLGLTTDTDEDQQLLATLLSMMEETGADYTMTFRQLASVHPDSMLDSDVVKNCWALSRLMRHEYYVSFAEMYRRRVYSEGGETFIKAMRTTQIFTLYLCDISINYIPLTFLLHSLDPVE